MIETAKSNTEKLTGIGRPTGDALDAAIEVRTAVTYKFKRDGIIPNHPHWPLLVFRGAVALDPAFDPATVFEDLFQRNGWGNSWRNGIYNYAHYHSRIHEVLGIARGEGRVRVGGDHGRILKLKAGDVVVLPAGTGHHALFASKDFLVVGAYPPTGSYDECSSIDELKSALVTIPKVARPSKDPVYGANGPLLDEWRAAVKRSPKTSK